MTQENWNRIEATIISYNKTCDIAGEENANQAGAGAREKSENGAATEMAMWTSITFYR